MGAAALGVSIALSSIAVTAHAQQDSLIQRIRAAYNGDNCSEVIVTMTSERVSSLSPPNRARAEIFHGACLFDRGDSSSAYAAYARAVTADVTVKPDTTLFAPDRVAMYNRARSTLPVVDDVRLSNNSFRPLLNERIVFHYSMEVEGPTRRVPSRLTLTLTARDSGWSHVLHGDPQSQVVVWDGRLGPSGQLAPAGQYEIAIAAFDSVTDQTTTFRTNLVVDTPPALTNPWFQSLPLVPMFRAESVQVRGFDVDRQRHLRSRGLIATLVGTGAATIGYALSNSVAGGTSPNSFGRYASAGLYTGGVAIGVFGVVNLLQGVLGDHQETIATPVTHAIANNRTIRTEFRRNIRTAVEHNHLAVSSFVMRLRIGETDQSRASSGRLE